MKSSKRLEEFDLLYYFPKAGSHGLFNYPALEATLLAYRQFS